jgi:hypothetical protein
MSMIQDVLDSLYLRQASVKDVNALNTPSHYRVLYNGCGHIDIITAEQAHKPIENRQGSDYHFCRKCNVGDKSGNAEGEGFCRKSVLHPIASAPPLFSRQYNQAQQRFKSASSSSSSFPFTPYNHILLMTAVCYRPL